jgi:hypothetical protein
MRFSFIVRQCAVQSSRGKVEVIALSIAGIANGCQQMGDIAAGHKRRRRVECR